MEPLWPSADGTGGVGGAPAMLAVAVNGVCGMAANGGAVRGWGRHCWASQSSLYRATYKNNLTMVSLLLDHGAARHFAEHLVFD